MALVSALHFALILIYDQCSRGLVAGGRPSAASCGRADGMSDMRIFGRWLARSPDGGVLLPPLLFLPLLFIGSNRFFVGRAQGHVFFLAGSSKNISSNSAP